MLTSQCWIVVVDHYRDAEIIRRQRNNFDTASWVLIMDDLIDDEIIFRSILHDKIGALEGADKFGLAQLHQFRGRVGRADSQSFCLLIPETEDALENERLAVMVQTNDGFVLAERDLQQRGPGEFLGTRQAGYATSLKMASLSDIQLIEKARTQAQALFTRDPDLKDPENNLLAEALVRFWGGGKGDVS